MKHIVIGLVATLAMGSAIAQSPQAQPAAQVRADTGLVQVDGAPVAPANTLGAQVGDMVTATDGQATVTYADGCVVRVVETHQIAAVSPCKAGLVPIATIPAESDGLLVAAGIGGLVLVGAAVAGSGGSDTPPPPPPPRPSSP